MVDVYNLGRTPSVDDGEKIFDNSLIFLIEKSGDRSSHQTYTRETQIKADDQSDDRIDPF